VTVVEMNNHSVDIFEHVKKGEHTSSFYITSVTIEGAVSEKFLK
jgi:hypothetical protein